MTNTTGILKFFDFDKGFGFAETAQGDLRIGREATKPEQHADLVGGAELVLETLRGKDGPVVVRVVEITIPFKKGVIKWFDQGRNMGFIVPAEGGNDVLLPGQISANAGVLPWDGLPVHYLAVAKKGDRLAATKVYFPTLDEEVVAKSAEVTVTAAEVVAAKSAPALSPYVVGETLQATVRWFHTAKGYGYLVADGKEGDLFVHVTEAKAVGDLVEGLELECEVARGKNGNGVRAVNLRFRGASPVDAVAEDLAQLFVESPAVVPAPEPEAGKTVVVTRKRRRQSSQAKAEGVIHKDEPLTVDALPDNQMAAAFAAAGLVKVGNGLDHAASPEGHAVH